MKEKYTRPGQPQYRVVKMWKGENMTNMEKHQYLKINTHSSRFDECLLNAIRYISANHQERALRILREKEKEEAFAMLKCCKDTGKSVFTHEAAAFDGSFEAGCQSNAVPYALLSLVSLLLLPDIF